MSFSQQDFVQNLNNVSRETELSTDALEKLELYKSELIKWQKKINLVSNSTIKDIWQRHFLDSAQLFPLMAGIDGIKLDIGSGAGFPALVLAIMGVDGYQLIESDIRKTIFLKEIARKCELDVIIHAKRIEMAEVKNVKLITARALADLNKLFEYSEPFLNSDTICLFQKGQNGEQEVIDAKKNWSFDLEEFKSISDDNAYIYKCSNLVKL